MTTDTPQMTRSQVQEMYEKEVSKILELKENAQTTSMALNEARRWLDRTMSMAVPDTDQEGIPCIMIDHGTHSLTLGERLKQNIAEADRLRLEKQERENREARERRERHVQEVTLALDSIKSRVTSSILEGSIPKSIRLPRVLDDPRRLNVSINRSGHQDYGLWQSQMETWAHDQGLVLDVVSEHDGMGVESWWALKVQPL